jgi:hypothetical protein
MFTDGSEERVPIIRTGETENGGIAFPRNVGKLQTTRYYIPRESNLHNHRREERHV